MGKVGRSAGQVCVGGCCTPVGAEVRWEVGMAKSGQHSGHRLSRTVKESWEEKIVMIRKV